MSEPEETKKQRIDAVLEDSLASTLDILEELPDSARVRELRARAQTYRLAVERWAAVRPSAAQRDALRELVIELHTRAMDERISEAPTPALGVPSARPPRAD